MARFEISRPYLERFLVDLLNTPSPTGDTEYAAGFIEGELLALDIASVRTKKGAVLAQVNGFSTERKRCVSAHIDTLGVMVKEIKPSGRLKMTALNAIMWPTIESEGVTISTSSGRTYRGSIVLANGAAHVNPEAKSKVRDADTLEIRLDERTTSAEETRLLGIDVGDYVYLDPRVEISSSGFIRSRFLDDKACVAALVAALSALRQADITPAFTTNLLFSNFEEVGHGGMDSVPADLDEMLVLDMACIGEGQNGSEFHCSICVKDSCGPYSKIFTDQLRGLANLRGIDLRPDIYPRYSSDGTAYWVSGGGAQVALIGPGVDTSHGYERTHFDSIAETAQLVAEYLVSE